jgi:type I restriction-modification system DNA methylase subunit
MAFDQSKLFKKLEGLVSHLSKNEFIYDFLLAFGSPKATITKLKNSYGSAGVLLDESVILKNKIYFQIYESGGNLHALCESAKNSTHVSKNKIRFVIVTDFEDIVAYDTKAKDTLDTEFIELPKSYAFFLPLANIEKFEITSEHPADVKASYKMGQLCDVIRKHNGIETEERTHAFNVFLTRLLFCFYAEDTGIFDKNQMVKAIQNTTLKSGKDLKEFFISFFKVLNLHGSSQERITMPDHFTDFPYVNGGLFAEDTWIPDFTDKARRLIIEIGSLEWEEINPDIFGSMFQAVIDPEQRGLLGQHYTSVPNIMKVIKPLFLDDLIVELELSKNSAKKLQKLLLRIQKIRVFDPACGSGNFLIISYKELRKLEMAVFKALDKLADQSVMCLSGIRLSQFYGIEIDDFAHEIALLSLWLAENQMNKLFEAEFEVSEPDLPLKASGNIYRDNSLRADWNDICPKQDAFGPLEVFVCGNPPFISFKERNKNKEQSTDMELLFSKAGNWKQIDYVGAWFYKGAQYIQGTNIKLGLVATNSLIQGEQVSLLWEKILQKNVEISFGYKSFSWSNSAKGKAAVHVVIVGLACEPKEKFLFEINEDKNAIKRKVKNISPYLIDAGNTIVASSSRALSPPAKLMQDGNNYTKSGDLFLTSEQKLELEIKYPELQKYIKRVIGGDEFLNNKERYCFWLVNYDPKECHAYLVNVLNKCKQDRLGSSKKETREKASLTPHLFPEVRQPKSGDYLVIPRVTSSRRKYVPIDIMSHEVITTNQVLMVTKTDRYDFGILTSEMHNDWMRTVAGRLKSDYRYSASLVYNTFPWPEVNEKQTTHIEALAEEVLLVRADHVEKTLAQMYDPDKMPTDLRDAHKALDTAVEKLYRTKPFESEIERVRFLFKKYEQLISKEGNYA